MRSQQQTLSWHEREGIPKINHYLINYNQENRVLVQNHVRRPFNPKFIGDYRIVALKGNQIEIQPATGGPTEMKHIKHVKYILPTDLYINQLPNYSMFGRKTTFGMKPYTGFTLEISQHIAYYK